MLTCIAMIFCCSPKESTKEKQSEGTVKKEDILPDSIKSSLYPLGANDQQVFLAEYSWTPTRLWTLERNSGKYSLIDYEKRILSMFPSKDIIILSSGDTLIIQQYSSGKSLKNILCPYEVQYLAISEDFSKFVIGPRSREAELYYYNSEEFLPAFKFYSPKSAGLRIISQVIEHDKVYLLDETDNWNCTIFELNIGTGSLKPILSGFAHDGWPSYVQHSRFFIQDQVPINGVFQEGSERMYIVDVGSRVYFDLTSIVLHERNRCDPIVAMNGEELLVPCHEDLNYIDLTKLDTIEYSSTASFILK